MALPTLQRRSPLPVRSSAAQESSWQRDVQQTTPRIDVKFPILGFLMDSEATGYDLKRRFRNPVGFFYRVSDGSLYPALKKLARDGLVTQRVERHGRRSRKVYAITEAGRARFLKTLREPAQPVFVFDEAQVKIYFAHHDPEAALHHVERERRFAVAWQSFLERLLEEMRAHGASPFRTSMVEIGHGIAALKADLFAKLTLRLERDLRGAPRARSGTRGGRKTGETLRDARKPVPAQAKNGART